MLEIFVGIIFIVRGNPRACTQFGAIADVQSISHFGSLRPILLKNSFFNGREEFLSAMTNFVPFYTGGI